MGREEWEGKSGEGGGISVMEKIVLMIKLNIVEYRRDSDCRIYIWPIFSHVAET